MIVSKHKVKEERNLVQEVFLKLNVSKTIFKCVANHHTQQKSLHLVFIVNVTEECPLLENLKQSHY